MSDNSGNMRVALLTPPVSQLSVCASLRTFFALIGDAHRMAYVDPYVGPRRERKNLAPDSPDARDPTW